LLELTVDMIFCSTAPPCAPCIFRWWSTWKSYWSKTAKRVFDTKKPPRKVAVSSYLSPTR